MDQNTMLMLGYLKLQNPITKAPEMFQTKGFDVVGFFFPFLRYAIAGMWGKAILTALLCVTVIGYPIMAWLTAFNFRQARVEHLIAKGWTVVSDATPAAHAKAA